MLPLFLFERRTYMERFSSYNTCFNFFTDPDVKFVSGIQRDSTCDYDLYIIFGECAIDEYYPDQIDEADKIAYEIVCDKDIDNAAAEQKIMDAVNKLYGTDPVIDVIIRKRKFPEG